MEEINKLEITKEMSLEEARYYAKTKKSNCNDVEFGENLTFETKLDKAEEIIKR